MIRTLGLVLEMQQPMMCVTRDVLPYFACFCSLLSVCLHVRNVGVCVCALECSLHSVNTTQSFISWGGGSRSIHLTTDPPPFTPPLNLRSAVDVTQ